MAEIINDQPPPPPPPTNPPAPFNAKDFVVQKGYWLTGKNYFQWSQFIRHTLKCCDMPDHIEGNPPLVTAPNFPSWDKDDSAIITWLWNSISPEISRNCMYLSSAKAVWEYLRRSYSMKQDMSACYDLKRKIFNTKQGNLSITEYFGVLNGFWIELDQYQNLKMECSKDTATLNTVVERDRIFDFLAGLNAEFDPIRVQILVRKPVVKLCFMNIPPDVSALVASKTTRQGSPPSSSKNVRDKFYCEHCNRSRHTKDRCFKLHGREQVLSRGGGSRNMHQYQAHVATHVQDTESFEKRGTDLSSFSQNDVERLKSMLDSMSKPSGSGSLAVTDVTFHENVSYFTRSQSQGENISDLESESESESEFLILGPSLPRTPISVPSLEPELSPSLSLSPSSTPESEPVSVPGPSRPSVLQESAPPAPTLVYQRRSKPDLLQKQIQSPEPEEMI
ncbi:hypothetical protein KIW84_013754 [Lathyrus oleraceus]|uniref:Retrotransposon gag domain-containing protein n=1 Tax=Pisum sativum TaxID=3888 RepID=A0A9D5GY74_PEA|nr:hypothetical protein KIW84_013754 [Pisum sativum]